MGKLANLFDAQGKCPSQTMKLLSSVATPLMLRYALLRKATLKKQLFNIHKISMLQYAW